MASKKSKILVCDFETTVYPGQVSTQVWASACVEIGTEDVKIFGSIEDTLDYFISLDTHITAYYHNLKFDGAFWLDFLLRNKKYTQALMKTGDGNWDYEFMDTKDMKNNMYKYNISEMGQWYTIIIKVKGNYIEIRDSLKLLPFSVKSIGDSFGTAHKKLEMDYEGFRYPGCNITEEEREYIANDVLVVKEALGIMFKEGHNKLTIGACCLSEYKNICNHNPKSLYTYDEMFPNLYEITPSDLKTISDSAGEYIHKSYRGGWCYLVKGKEERIYKNGITADVNSLYPSVMSSESGCKYPVGKPHFWEGNYIPDEALRDNSYFFIRIKTRFYIKYGMLPFIQIKNNLLYDGTEMLETSDVYDEKNDEYYTHYKGFDGEWIDTTQEMTMTMTDYYLLLEHYELVDFEILSGCWFYALTGIFDEYIEKYKKIKMESKGAMRTLAKLFLNNLYGKMATNPDSSFKIARLKDDGNVSFVSVKEAKKTPGYIAVGSAITSYAREFTIRTAQKNYHGKDKPGFIYADTDSIHCDLSPDELIDTPIDSKKFCHWKLESSWDEAIFTRQKTYIEHITHEELQPLEKPYYNIKCAGMPDRCKELFNLSLNGDADPSGYISRTGKKKNWTEEEKDFLFNQQTDEPIIRTLKDFTAGLKIPGKLLPKRIPGGVLLKETTYEMRY